ncbi:MAG: hypothetical protein IPQ06_15595 [Chitinophagaceae bacterium]|nr:hypothetical protein [Chitinophagaceae bacterium]
MVLILYRIRCSWPGDQFFHRNALKDEKISIPFSLHRVEGKSTWTAQVKNEVVVGFTNPITYRLELGKHISLI